MGILEADMRGLRLDKVELTALQIIFSELEGVSKYNFEREEFEEIKRP